MDRSTKACLFLNGKKPGKALIGRYCPPGYLKICTDGAYDYLHEYGIEPDILLGDLDSVSALPSQPPFEVIRLPDVNAGDFEKALAYCKENAIGLVRIFGADGERIDHFLINIILMTRSAGEIDIEMFTEKEYLHFLLPGEYHIPGVKGQRFSLLALKRTKELTLRGAAYPLDNNTLETGSRGLSNTFSGAELLIRFEQGLLLFMTEIKT